MHAALQEALAAKGFFVLSPEEKDKRREELIATFRKLGAQLSPEAKAAGIRELRRMRGQYDEEG